MRESTISNRGHGIWKTNGGQGSTKIESTIPNRGNRIWNCNMDLIRETGNQCSFIGN